MEPPHVGVGDLTPAAAVTSSFRYLYTLSNMDCSISEFRIGAGGLLKPLPGRAVAAHKADVLVITHDGRYLYAIDGNSSSIYSYKIAPDGLLKRLAYTTRTEKLPLNMAFDSTGKFAYVICGDGGDPQAGSNTIDEYRVNKNGSLSPLNPWILNAGYWGGQLFAATNKPYIYLPDQSGLTEYRVSATGHLVDPVKTPRGASYPQMFGVMDEQLGYVVATAVQDTSRSFPDELVVTKVEGGDKLSVVDTYSMDDTGALNYGGDQFASRNHPFAAVASLVLDPAKHIVYAIDAESFKIFRYRINPDGTITQLLPSGITGHAPQPPNTEHMFLSFAYYADSVNYLFFVPKSGGKP
jgi:hypothetical protein